MGFSKEWDQCYIDNMQMSVWPWSDLVSLVHRHCKPVIAKGGGRVLELGCGAGANIPLFLTLGMDYYAIEGSQTIVKQLHQRYPDLARKILVGDFTLERPFECDFDLVIDRSALTHNNTASIRNALQIISESLKPEGMFIGTDWFSTDHDDAAWGVMCDDEFTKTNHTKGQFAGVGKVHFSDEPHLRDLFSKFEIVHMEEKLIRWHKPRDDHQLASWNIVARKPHG